MSIAFLSLPAQPRAQEPNLTRSVQKTNHNAAVDLLARPLKQYDASLAISATTVIYKLKQKQRLTLVDVRDKEEFERLKIPGSINIALHAIKTKAFLKPSPIVLVNQGCGYSRLQAECRRLEALGFKVSILDGGLPAWRRKGGFLVGDLLALNDMKDVSAREFFPESRYANVLMIDATRFRSADAARLMPQAVHLADLLQSPSAQSRLRQMIKARRGQPLQSVLVVSSTGEGYADVKRLLDRERIHAFYLEGGLAAYSQYLENLALSWQPREARTRKIVECNTCGSSTGQASSQQAETTTSSEEGNLSNNE